MNTGRTYYSYDLRGNVTERLYATGGSYQVDLYDAWGNRSEALTDYSDPWGFGAQAGYFTDLETGLILCTHRFYAPFLGKFITRDPMGYGGGINLYGYCQNDPVNGIDPSGLDAKPIKIPIPGTSPGTVVNTGPPISIQGPISGGPGSGTYTIALPTPINRGSGSVGGTYVFGSPDNGVTIQGNYPGNGSGASGSVTGTCKFHGGSVTGGVSDNSGGPAAYGSVNGVVTTAPGSTITFTASGSGGSGPPNFGGYIGFQFHPF